MAGLTYREAGVDIDAAQDFVERIKPLAASTRRPEVLADVGGFAGLFRVPAGLEDPVLVSGTDGVGTKLKLAFAMDRHDTIGIDLVAMCVNDIVTTGARPLFFLDYFATAALDVERATAVVRGIADGCRQAGCVLLGGETAEMPGMYKPSEYDLAGFAVGVVERSRLIDGKRVEVGDVVVAVASSGLHSNGYSLAQKALFERGGLSPEASVDGLAGPIGDALLAPTRIYAKAVERAVAEVDVRAICHVTGGGLPENLPRVLPAGTRAVLETAQIDTPALFGVIERSGGIERAEMWRTFNMGVGMAFVVPPADADPLLAVLGAAGETAFVCGGIHEARRGADPDVELRAEAD